MKNYLSIFYKSSLILLLLSLTVRSDSFTDEIQESIRNRIETAGIPARIIASGNLLYASHSLPAFYEKRGYFPVWINAEGANDLANSLVS